MASEYVRLWNKCLHIIKDNVNAQSFKTWFEPIKAVGYEDNTLTLQVPNRYFYEFLEEHYVPVLRKSIRQEIGNDCKLEYQILPSKHGRNRRKASTQNQDNSSYSIEKRDSKTIPNPFVIPGLKKQKIDSQLNPKYRFENFIEGDCNRLARGAGYAIADSPGRTSFNPLFIYGDVGLGKTHLAQAIGNAAREKRGDINILYVSCEKFTNQIIESIKSNSVNDLVYFYQMIDLLIVDDIQFLRGKNKTQEIFFHIFNQLYQNQKQIVLTSDRVPKDLKGMQDRLINRFKWGLNADLQAPELETRIAILESKLDDEGIEFPSDVVEFICFNVKDNIRELEGVIINLLAQAGLNSKEIDIDLAREVVKEFISEVSKEITIENLQALVADHFDIPLNKLIGNTRKRKYVVPRQIAMYLAKKLTDNSLKSIGEQFGGRDHTTVLYSCKTVRQFIETDKKYEKELEDIEKKVRMSLYA